MKNIIIIYFTIINILAIGAYGLDKIKAKKGSYRISERMLLILAILGGSVGALMGMQMFHHKTKHMIFKWGIPSIIVIQYVIILLFNIERGMI